MILFLIVLPIPHPLFFPSTLQPLYYRWMAFNASSASSKTPPGRKEFFRMNRSQHFQYFPHMLWNAGNPFTLSSTASSSSSSSSFLPPLFPLPPLSSSTSFCPSLCSVRAGVEPLYRRGVLGRASKAFITGFAVLYYTGKHRATHAWPLTSLWSSAIHEKRGLWPANVFLV